MAAMLIWAYWQIWIWLYKNKKLRHKIVTIFSFYSPTFKLLTSSFKNVCLHLKDTFQKFPFYVLWMTSDSLIVIPVSCSSLLLSTTYSLLSKVRFAFIDNNNKWLYQKKGSRSSYGSEWRDLKSINRSGSFWMFWETLPLTLSYSQGYTAFWLVVWHYAIFASLFT